MNRYTWFAAMSRNEPGSMNRAPGCDPCNEPNWFERFIATKSNISHVLGSVNYSYAQSSFSQRCLPIKAHSGFVLSPNLKHQPGPLCRAPQGSLGLPGVPYRPSTPYNTPYTLLKENRATNKQQTTQKGGGAPRPPFFNILAAEYKPTRKSNDKQLQET